jgi:metacaspase-1
MAKKALIIGVNDYAPIGTGGPDLNGCVNDAQDMANTLVICGFKPADIRILTNKNATRANILAWLNWLFTGIVSGDSLVFYYSGHGTRVTNFNNDLEVDGLDEAICPHDYNSAGGGLITDDEFKTLFAQKMKAGVNLEVILDCCHSGTGTRASVVQNSAVRGLPQDLETTFYEMHAVAKSTTKRGLVPTAGLNHTLWAGCKDSQECLESSINGIIRGHFTLAFCKALKATNGNITRSALDTQVKNALAVHGPSQINQTESQSAEFSQIIFK